MDRVELFAYLKTKAEETFSARGLEEQGSVGSCWFTKPLDEDSVVSIALVFTSTIRTGVRYFPHVHLRIHEVEKIVAEHILKSKKAPAVLKALNSSSTFASTLEYLTPEPNIQKYFAFESPEQIDRLLNQTAEDFFAYGVPFAAKYSTVPALLKVLENPRLPEHTNIRINIFSEPVIYILAGHYAAARQFIKDNYFGPGSDTSDIRGQVPKVTYGERLLAYLDAIE